MLIHSGFRLKVPYCASGKTAPSSLMKGLRFIDRNVWFSQGKTTRQVSRKMGKKSEKKISVRMQFFGFSLGKSA